MLPVVQARTMNRHHEQGHPFLACSHFLFAICLIALAFSLRVFFGKGLQVITFFLRLESRRYIRLSRRIPSKLANQVAKQGHPINMDFRVSVGRCLSLDWSHHEQGHPFLACSHFLFAICLIALAFSLRVFFGKGLQVITFFLRLESRRYIRLSRRIPSKLANQAPKQG